MKTRLSILVLAVLLVSACSSDNGFETAVVSQSEFGDRWPFAADQGALACEPGRVPTFTVDGTTVGLDEPNLSSAAWASTATEATASAMRDEALKLCD